MQVPCVPFSINSTALEWESLWVLCLLQQVEILIVHSPSAISGFMMTSFGPSIVTLFIYTLMIGEYPEQYHDEHRRSFSGLGCGLMRTCVFSVQCEYFGWERRNLVMSVISIGPGIGICFFPKLFTLLTEYVRISRCDGF